MNPMREVKIEKVTLNVGAGKEQTRLEKGVLLLKGLTGINPVKTFTNKRIPSWGLRPGLPIGCKLTLRKKKAEEIFKQLKAKPVKLKRFLKHNAPKERKFGPMKKLCRLCGNPRAHISKYGLNL